MNKTESPPVDRAPEAKPHSTPHPPNQTPQPTTTEATRKKKNTETTTKTPTPTRVMHKLPTEPPPHQPREPNIHYLLTDTPKQNDPLNKNHRPTPKTEKTPTARKAEQHDEHGTKAQSKHLHNSQNEPQRETADHAKTTDQTPTPIKPPASKNKHQHPQHRHPPPTTQHTQRRADNKDSQNPPTDDEKMQKKTPAQTQPPHNHIATQEQPVTHPTTASLPQGNKNNPAPKPNQTTHTN
ncbi:hypothetical protein BV25DRAFT_1915621 [Artomyces pyxidatus]|uniref:Uncharacterized protein n=1 Tax=Artomyces pyxidatus TaxID=48021 RepID=A0ACB8T321_9AGAM|nr:hypothetical protein BV25DRAFT_1915621 [Artomyces pyxidatus]